MAMNVAVKYVASLHEVLNAFDFLGFNVADLQDSS